MSLVVVGTVAYDSVETPFGRSGIILGGAATYISLAATFFTEKVNIISVVGGDFLERYLDLLKDKKIDLEGLQIDLEGKTFFWSGKYHTDLNIRDTLVTDLNVLAGFKPFVPEKYKDCKYLMLGNLTPAVQISVLDQLPEKPDLVVLDTMNFWMNNALDDLKTVLKRTDVLTINDEEARQLSNEYSLVKAAGKILKMGPSFLIIKKGEHGALLFSKDNMFFAPALPLEEVFDPTGAGDTFAGGFIGYLSKTNDLSFDNMKRAVIYGSALASFCVEKFGTEKLLEISKNDIFQRVQQFISLSEFNLKDF